MSEGEGEAETLVFMARVKTTVSLRVKGRLMIGDMWSSHKSLMLS